MAHLLGAFRCLPEKLFDYSGKVFGDIIPELASEAQLASVFEAVLIYPE